MWTLTKSNGLPTSSPAIPATEPAKASIRGEADLVATSSISGSAIPQLGSSFGSCQRKKKLLKANRPSMGNKHKSAKKESHEDILESFCPGSKGMFDSHAVESIFLTQDSLLLLDSKFAKQKHPGLNGKLSSLFASSVFIQIPKQTQGQLTWDEFSTFI